VICSPLIPYIPEMSALTWMLRIWQSHFPQGASIDTVARWCILRQEDNATGELTPCQKNDVYMTVYGLSFELTRINLLIAPAPSTPLLYRPVQPWFKPNQSAHFGETATP
jgi:hypothetical protein